MDGTTVRRQRGRRLRASVRSKHELRSVLPQRSCPNVYLRQATYELDTASARLRRVAVVAARGGGLAGLTASALHGAKWVDDAAPIELIWRNARSPRGVHDLRDLLLRAESAADLDGLPVTTPERTAFDLGRRGRLDAAVARLDALGNATRLQAPKTSQASARDHRGTVDCASSRRRSTSIDPGAESPKETWLRLMLIRAGYPRPADPDPGARAPTAVGGTTSTWVGRTSCWPSSTTATNIGRRPSSYAYDIQRAEDHRRARLDTVMRVAAATPRQPTSLHRVQPRLGRIAIALTLR